jgi:serine phosphatase RsbU (regulator of sigma subunit)
MLIENNFKVTKKMARNKIKSWLKHIALLKSENQQLKQKLEVNKEIEKNTQLLKIQNEEMNMQREYLEAMVQELEQNERIIIEKNKLLEKTIKILDEAHENINASLNYSKRIQDAMLPRKEVLKYFFKENFILFKPKDVVSGDFYWFSKVGHKFIVAAVDCTGHGVPGALMSIIGMEILHNIVNEQKITDPALILEKMHENIKRILKQDENDVRDGMDMAIITIDKRTEILEYAGAKNPLVLIKDNQIVLFKGSKYSVGGYHKVNNLPFQKITIPYEKDVCCYIFSDGFQDLYNESINKRLGSAEMRKILLNIHHHTMEQQEKILHKIMKYWLKNAQKQLDDVMVIGIKL